MLFVIHFNCIRTKKKSKSQKYFDSLGSLNFSLSLLTSNQVCSIRRQRYYILLSEYIFLFVVDNVIWYTKHDAFIGGFPAYFRTWRIIEWNALLHSLKPDILDFAGGKLMSSSPCSSNMLNRTLCCICKIRRCYTLNALGNSFFM